MFQWFHRKTESHQTDSATAELWNIAAALHDLRERDPAAIYDLAFLPAAKDDLKRALHIAWGLAITKEQRFAIEASYLFLAQFQEGVGRYPISGDFFAAPTVEENTRVMNRWIPWAAVCDSERWTLWIEWSRFKRGESAETAHETAPALEPQSSETGASEPAEDGESGGRHAA